jgi:hypothetical protein
VNPTNHRARRVLGAIAAVVVAVNVARLASPVRERLRIISSQRGVGADGRMRLQWPDLYELVTLIRRVTPPDSTIVIPPPWGPEAGVWADVSNKSIVQSFLHPRTILWAPELERVARVPGRSLRPAYIVVLSRPADGVVHSWPPAGSFSFDPVMATCSGWGIARLGP